MGAPHGHMVAEDDDGGRLAAAKVLLPYKRLLLSIRHVSFADLVAGTVLGLVLAGFGAAFSSVSCLLCATIGE